MDQLVLVALLVVLLTYLWSVFLRYVWKPHVAAKKFKMQGITGPKYKFFVGNSNEIKKMRAVGDELVMDVHDHDIIPRVHPHFSKWISLHGKTYLYWLGPKPTLCVGDANMVRQVLTERTGLYPKHFTDPNLVSLLGKGLVLTDGEIYARHRKVVHPAFHMDRLKMMTKMMSECGLSMMNDWEAQVKKNENQQAEIEMSSQFAELTANIISHTAFGSSYREGKEVFHAQRKLQELAFSTRFDVHVPIFRYIPTAKNLKAWKFDSQVRNMLMQIIDNRLSSKETASYGDDLLGMMLESNASERDASQHLSMDEIIDECKTFFFAGHDTTSHLLTWTMFLLSTNQDWQEKLRQEVLGECGKEIPNNDMINNLKLVNMVLLESLRVYSPVSSIARKTGVDIELGHIKVPKGTGLVIPIATIHRDKEIWGDDVNEFNPMRFEHGVTKAAKVPNALVAFSLGPRSCIGQNFAMLEAKTLVAMILQRFSLTLSQKYAHAPMDAITLLPKFGLQIVLKPLEG